MPKGGDTRAAAAASGKKVGRPPKPQIPLDAKKGIATEVLAMDGAPEHVRVCKCAVCAGELKKKCECTFLEAQDGKSKIKITCHFCHTREDHLVCHCEVCGWWELLLAKDKHIVKEARKYLTDRRDGKPAQGVFIGDTRENARELDFGDLPELIATSKPVAARKPN